jgi:hypothetical protein
VDGKRKRPSETDQWLEIIHERVAGTVAGHLASRQQKWPVEIGQRLKW